MAPSESLHLAEALTTLSGERWPIMLAKRHVPPTPGLYAIYGDTTAWTDLGLDPEPNSPLYVGKSEDNLVRRELDTHFAVDPAKKTRTGSSTVRRSFAALMRDALELQAIPRNPEKPGYFSNYGLTLDGDTRLTAWMHERLSIAVWLRPTTLAHSLKTVESAIIHRWMPPLNIADNPRPLPRLRTAREAMTREASASHPSAASRPPLDEKPARTSAAQEPTPAARAPGLGPTPVELARELRRSPKTVRQALRDRYGKLAVTGDRWGALTCEQESYIRNRFR
ncbi:GIY-YIG nuclease family protein [Sinomonas halotolerans]|uniref:GIY-YIG nuclease family protein n=1 Tax=Sinomonas halotolerans TaxID=1644133 RepID=A0ABU9WZZ0_9MICC